jgi:hypothetical protein
VLQTAGTNAVTYDANQNAKHTGSISSVNTFGFKNRIINGAMVIDQRNAGASVAVTAANTFVTDRFYVYGSASSKLTAQQNAGSVTPPVNFNNYLGFTSLSAYSVGSGDIFYFGHKIEGYNTADLGWGTANAKTITLSFQVYSSLTGTFGGVINNASTNYSYPFTYSISVANTWTTISVTIAGPTSGTWTGATNGIGLYIGWQLGVGSTYTATAGSWQSGSYYGVTGATSVVGTNGATFYITGVQLEVGSSATGFEYRQYQQELALCQRYYTIGTFPPSYNGGNTQADYVSSFVSFKVTMRAVPTMNSGTSIYIDGAQVTQYTVPQSYTGAVAYTASSEL